MQFPPVDEQLALIRRGVEKIVPEAELREMLTKSHKSGEPLRVKYGIDPTSINVHLGHSVPLRKMRQFQALGHQAVIIIGNYTALVGDPSGRDETRARLTAQQVEANARDYLEQVGKVIDLSHAEVVHNGDWFAPLAFSDILELTSRVTVAQLLTREDFAKRMQAGTAISLHECLYPIMQAFDSVVIASDIELGGTEQLYSFMLARDLQKDPAACKLAERFQPPAAKKRMLPGGTLQQQVGVMLPILVGTDGVRRMGKSLGNYIGLSESPYEMMKKFMQIPDGVMRMYFELLTDLPLEDVNRLLQGHPKEAKLTLAGLIIDEYHSHGGAVGPDAQKGEHGFSSVAANAIERWQREIGGGGLPQDIEIRTLSKSKLQNGAILPAELLTELKLCATKSDARRLIAQGGAKISEDKTPIADHETPLTIVDGTLVWAGKKKFCRLKLVD